MCRDEYSGEASRGSVRADTRWRGSSKKSGWTRISGREITGRMNRNAARSAANALNLEHRAVCAFLSSWESYNSTPENSPDRVSFKRSSLIMENTTIPRLPVSFARTRHRHRRRSSNSSGTSSLRSHRFVRIIAIFLRPNFYVCKYLVDCPGFECKAIFRFSRSSFFRDC